MTDIPLPGGAVRFDYQSLDDTLGRLYISHMSAGQLVVFDTKAQRVVAVADSLPGLTGVWAVPELGRVYGSVTGLHQVAIIDAHSLSRTSTAAPCSASCKPAHPQGADREASRLVCAPGGASHSSPYASRDPSPARRTNHWCECR